MTDWTYHMRHGDFATAWEIRDAVLRVRAGAPRCHLSRHRMPGDRGAVITDVARKLRAMAPATGPDTWPCTTTAN